MALIVKFIESEELKGDGTEVNPWRKVIQLWTKKGLKIAECDPHTGESFFTPMTVGEREP